MDTRIGGSTVDGYFAGGGAVGPGSVTKVTIASRGGVPVSGVGSVALNVTATSPTSNSFVTVWPTGAARPNASNLNLRAGVTTPNMVIVALGAGGQISLFNANGSTNLLVDVLGWFPTGGSFTGLVPARLMDTRVGASTIDHLFEGAGPVGPASVTNVAIRNRGGVPETGMGAVALNVTATGPTSNSFVTVWPSEAERPNASSLNLRAGITTPNMVIVPVGPSGEVSLFNSNGSTNLIVDVLGWFPTGASFAGLVPARLMDTRDGAATVDGLFVGGGPVGSGSVTNLTVLNRGGVPLRGVGSVALNVTAAGPIANSFLTVWPTGAARPNASNLNLRAGVTTPNMVIVALGAGGQISLFNNSGQTNLIVDVLGWFPSTLTLSTQAVKPGDVISIGGSGFKPNSELTITLHSDPLELGTTTADDQGSTFTEVTIPGDVGGGEHHIVVSGLDDGDNEYSLSAPLTVDFDPPTIASSSVTPAVVAQGGHVELVVDVRDESGTASVNWVVTRVATGMQSFYGSPGCGQNQSMSQSTGVPAAGLWEQTCTIPALAASGLYEVAVQPRDVLDNAAAPVVIGSFTVTGGVDDDDAPAIQSSSLSTGTVAPGGSFSISAAITDTVGVDRVNWTVIKQSTGNQAFYGSTGCGQNQSMPLVAGTTKSGTWTQVCTIPALVANGVYDVAIQATDLLNNSTPSTVVGTITITGGASDDDPPSIVSTSVTPSSIAKGGTVTIAVNATDATGVSSIGWMVQSVTTGTQVFYGTAGCPQNQSMPRTSGSPAAGQWTQLCTVPSNANIDTYRVYIIAVDVLNNSSLGYTLAGSFVVS